tara:strand:+ start:2049 stop:2417 length:369 start_codon:yes stop_codon:yes gene_type:complete
MHIETQTKTSKLSIFRKKQFFKTLATAGLLTTLASCSFVELQHGAENIIFAKQGDGCELIKIFTAEVKISTFYISRRPEAIAEELQMLAQNEAYALYANAIWPSSEIENGTQSFELLRCEAL